MKRFILTLGINIACMTAANAIPLFPYFVDAAGDYKDGTPVEMSAVNLKSMYYRQTPSFYSTLEDADAFLNDVMPYSSEPIQRCEAVLGDGRKLVTYTSPMSDGKVTSVIYLLPTEDGKYIICYDEKAE